MDKCTQLQNRLERLVLLVAESIDLVSADAVRDRAKVMDTAKAVQMQLKGMSETINELPAGSAPIQSLLDTIKQLEAEEAAVDDELKAALEGAEGALVRAAS